MYIERFDVLSSYRTSEVGFPHDSQDLPTFRIFVMTVAPSGKLLGYPFVSVTEFDEICQKFFKAYCDTREPVGNWTHIQLLAGVGCYGLKLDAFIVDDYIDP
jgi:hypothetical protein